MYIYIVFTYMYVFRYHMNVQYMYMYMYMNDQSLRQGKAKQLRLKTTPFSQEELPQAGLEPMTFCIPGRRSTN